MTNREAIKKIFIDEIEKMDDEELNDRYTEYYDGSHGGVVLPKSQCKVCKSIYGEKRQCLIDCTKKCSMTDSDYMDMDVKYIVKC